MKDDVVKSDAFVEIIQSEEDRLFVVDRECYIIYTGTSSSDERPFIRIGNYINLPVEIIPHIENIVITDLLVGNPAFEQFNVDVRYLSQNRYIGSLPVVTKYLDYQKVFGLDLTNAKVVDVEKDVPFIQNKKELKDSDAFIGIFYTNGNFKIHHKKTFVLDLVRETESAFDEKKIMERLVGITRQSRRYEGEGVVFLGQTPFFYKNSSFVSYHFPRYFLEECARLSIDLAQLNDVIHPSANFIHISRLLRLKHATKGRLLLITDHADQFVYMQKLFANAALSRKNFTGILHDFPNGISISNNGKNFNITFQFARTKPHRLDLVLTYVKGMQGIAEVVKQKQDGIIVPSSIYEQFPTLLRSSNIPCLIFADTNFAVKNLRDPSAVLLHSGIQYEFRKYGSISDIKIDVSKIIANILKIVENSPNDLEKVVKEKAKKIKNFLSIEDYVEVKNIIGLFRLQLEEEKNRKKAAALRNAIRELLLLDVQIVDKKYAHKLRVIIAFCENRVFEFIELLDENKLYCPFVIEEITEKLMDQINEVPTKEEREFYRRILRDRERLKKLLQLLELSESKQKLAELSSALKNRKDYFYTDEPAMNFQIDVPKQKGFFLKKAIAWFVVLLSMLFIAYSVVRLYERDIEYRAIAAKKLEEEKRRQLIDKYRIVVSTKDIFDFANKIAVENGYKPITYKGLKEKNPNWIYPGNKFQIERELIVIKEGDTLWDIAHQKLMERNINFYRLFDELKKVPKGSREFYEKYNRAKDVAYTNAQKKALKELLYGATDTGKR